MKELEVGDYVRTEDGYIAKCIEIDDTYNFDGIIRRDYGESSDYAYDDNLKAIKISSKLTDLLEIGDIVEVGWQGCRKIIYLADHEILHMVKFDYDFGRIKINRVLTKEQYAEYSYLTQREGI